MPDWCVIPGDALEALRDLDADSVDAIVTDPPAGIAFMGKSWDHDKGGPMEWIDWLCGILVECHRVLKPGGHALVWAIPRTSHWTGMAIELAGFEVRDVVTHLFGSGFPKSLNVSKAIDAADGVSAQRAVVSTYTAGGNAGVSTADKGGTYGVGVGTAAPVELAVTRGASERSRAWDGWGTALKPACEFWILARKPLEGTVARNVLEHGTGAINVDGCRIEADAKYLSTPGNPEPSAMAVTSYAAAENGDTKATRADPNTAGRWPANVVLSHSPKCAVQYFDDPKVINAWGCAPDCPVAMLDAQSGNRPGMSGGGKHRADATPGMFGAIDCTHTARGDQGGASRFFANFKADEDEWAGQDRNQHDKTDATSPPRAISGAITAAGLECSTMSSGSNTTGQSLPDTKSTTRTKTSKTTASKTSTCSTPRPISDSILDVSCGTGFGGNPAAFAVNSSRLTSGIGTSASKAGPSMGAVDPATLGLYANPSGTARIGYFPKTSTKEREAGCDALPLKSAGDLVDREEGSAGMNSPRAGAGRTSGGRRNSHPTCKSISLMRWLVRLITPPGGLVLDPFTGSGSTGCAAVLEGMDFVGIEQDPDYCAIAEARIAHWAK